METVYKEIEKIISESDLIIDIACGSKSLPDRFYTDSIKSKTLIGLDINKTFLHNAEKSGYKPVAADVFNLPLKNINAEFIILKYLLEHLTETDTILKEITRISGNGTFIYAVVPRYNTFQDTLYRCLGRTAELLRAGKQAHVQKFTYDSVCELFSNYNFKLHRFAYTSAGLSFLDKTYKRKIFKFFVLIFLKTVKLISGKNLLENNEMHFIFKYKTDAEKS